MEGMRPLKIVVIEIVLTLHLIQGGREIAEVSRPNTKEPPIMILSDGTVF